MSEADTVAFHPTCHLELHEHAGYAHLHGLRAELVADRDRLITLADLEAIARERRIWLMNRPAPSVVPGVVVVEYTVGDPAPQIAPAEAVELFARVLGSG